MSKGGRGGITFPLSHRTPTLEGGGAWGISKFGNFGKFWKLSHKNAIKLKIRGAPCDFAGYPPLLPIPPLMTKSYSPSLNFDPWTRMPFVVLCVVDKWSVLYFYRQEIHWGQMGGSIMQLIFALSKDGWPRKEYMGLFSRRIDQIFFRLSISLHRYVLGMTQSLPATLFYPRFSKCPLAGSITYIWIAQSGMRICELLA